MNSIYKAEIIISKDKKEEIDQLLSIEDLSNSGFGNKEDFENIVCHKFKNGSILFIDLVSGDINYYLQYMLYDKEDQLIEEDIFDNLESLEEIEDTENNNKYIIKFDFRSDLKNE